MTQNKPVFTEEEIAKVQSATSASSIVDEIVRGGDYIVDKSPGEFVTYSREHDGLVEKVTVKRLRNKYFAVVKSISMKEVLMTK
jgi:hypothetical protein